MQLHKLPKTTTPSKKRVGRGYGCGIGGHTSGRGQKGQKSRNSVAIWFEGGQLPFKKRSPFLRGKDRFKTLNVQPVIINVDKLNTLPADSEVTLDTLVKHNLVTLREATHSPVKILGRGTINVALTIKHLPLSAQAADKIVKAGGKVQKGTDSADS